WAVEIVNALTTIKSKYAENGWPEWGACHPLRLQHAVLGEVWPFAAVFNSKRVPFGGDADTINQGSVRPLKPLDFTDTIAGLRMVVDVGAWSNSRFVLAGGQSGNPMSPHYTDLFELWQKGEGVSIAWTPDEVRAASRQTLNIMGLSGGAA